MEYQASSVALSQKLSTGHSIYDGVFSSAPSKFNASSFSSRVEDYSEIFGGAGASRGSSIPVLEVPELHERKASIDVRSSKLDYSNVFGGFGDSDFAVPYEELFAEPKKSKKRTPPEIRSPLEEANPASDGNRVSSHESSYQSFDGAKKFNMSYNKSNHRSKSFTGGTTLHAVPAYTCLIDETTTPLHMTEGDKPVSFLVNGASPGNNLCEKMVEGNHYMKATCTGDRPAGDASKQTSGEGAKIQNNYDRKRSDSSDELFNAREIGQGTHPSNRPPITSLLSEDKVESVKPVASKFGVSKSYHFEGSDKVHSPPYFDEEVETNSIAAASATALRKAIEKAQARINMAKESKERKKVGLQNRVKPSFNNGTKLEVRKGDKFADKASIPKESKSQQLHEEVAAPIHVSTGPEQVTATFEDVEKVFSAKEAGGETEKESKLTQTGHRQEEVDESEAAEQTEEKECKSTQTGHRQEEAGVSEAAEQTEEQESKSTQTGHRQEDADVSEAAEQIEEKESKSTQTGLRQEEADVSEAAEQFYEFADTGEPDFSEAAEQFYEFSDSSEPDVSEPVELFYEFSDSSEHQATTLEHEEPSTALKMIRFEDEDEQKKKKTTTEAFDNPVLDVERLQAAEDQENREIEEMFNEDDNPVLDGEILQLAEDQENREIEEIFNADGGPSKSEEHASELETAQEAFDQKEDEKRQEASREHEEMGRLKASLFEEKPGELEKQKGDSKRLETQELQETRHVKRKLMPQEWVEYVIGKEACKQEEHERGQKDVRREKDTEKRFNKCREEIVEETLNDFNNEEDFEKRDESTSEGNEQLQDTRENEKILEGAACQKKECEKRQKESFQLEEAGRTQILIDLSTEDEKVKVAQEDLKNPVCTSEAANILCEQVESEDLNQKQEPAEHVVYDKDVEETPVVPAHEEDGGRIEVTETLVELKENGYQSELVEEDNGMVQKEIHEIDGLAPVVKLDEILKQMKDATEIHSFDKNEISAKRNDMSIGQNKNYQLAREQEVVCDFEEHVEELRDMNKDTMETEVAVKHEEGKNASKSSHRKRWFDKLDISETLNKLKENGNQSEAVEEENGIEEKEICETDGLAPGVKLAEILKQMEDPIETHPSEKDGINVDRNSMNYGKKQDDELSREPVVVCNLEKHVEELEETNMEGEVAVNQEENKNNSKSSHRKRWFGDGNNTEVIQLSHMLRRKAGNVLLDHEMETSLCTEKKRENHEKFLTNQRFEENEENQQTTMAEDSETIDSSLKELEQEKSETRQTTLPTEENETDLCTQKDVKEGKKENQGTLMTEESKKYYSLQKAVEQEKKENKKETMTAEECETSGSLQKEVAIEKEHLIQKANAKGRERERVKEKKAVERVIREARERAFAEARERAAETRQRAMAEAQERLGKTSVKANDTSLAEKASKESKLKSERAAVERATVEARDRALEKALSGKAAYEAGKQAKRSASEKFSSASRDDGMKPGVSTFDPESKGSFPSSTSRHPNSSNQGDTSSTEGGTNGESAQRSKARLERNQRTAERAAKALAEKNMRDLLVLKEQAERNRLAEALDAEVKRWSSGKERNLRALLSTLQYILGPDSGWQPIPLTDVVTAVAVKKAYRKAALFVHPDKLQQRGASIQQKYTCEKVFDLLKEAWNRFNVEER